MKGIQGEIIPKNKNFIAKEHFFGEQIAILKKIRVIL